MENGGERDGGGVGIAARLVASRRAGEVALW